MCVCTPQLHVYCDKHAHTSCVGIIYLSNGNMQSMCNEVFSFEQLIVSGSSNYRFIHICMNIYYAFIIWTCMHVLYVHEWLNIYHCSAVLVYMYNKWMSAAVCSVIIVVQNDWWIIWWKGYRFSSKQNGYIKLNYCAIHWLHIYNYNARMNWNNYCK